MHKYSDRLDGVDGVEQIAEFIGICRSTFYNLYFEDIESICFICSVRNV